MVGKNSNIWIKYIILALVFGGCWVIVMAADAMIEHYQWFKR